MMPGSSLPISDANLYCGWVCDTPSRPKLPARFKRSLFMGLMSNRWRACCCAVSHEYAQLQKQLLAANQEAALSASLVHQLTADAASAVPHVPAPQPEQTPSEPARGDGAAPSAGWLALSRSWDQGKLAVKVRLSACK